MVLVADEELFAEFGSLVVEVTDAVLVDWETELKVLAVTLMVMTAIAPTLRVGMVQETVTVARV
jgi:hypothetical protein